VCQRQAGAQGVALVRRLAAVLADDARGQGQTQARAALETAEEVAARLGAGQAAPLDDGRRAPARLLAPQAQLGLRRALAARAARDIFESFGQ
jgi:hypothetical protein